MSDSIVAAEATQRVTHKSGASCFLCKVVPHSVGHEAADAALTTCNRRSILFDI